MPFPGIPLGILKIKFVNKHLEKIIAEMAAEPVECAVIAVYYHGINQGIKSVDVC